MFDDTYYFATNYTNSTNQSFQHKLHKKYNEMPLKLRSTDFSVIQ
jgi:hypothetical protein